MRSNSLEQIWACSVGTLTNEHFVHHSKVCTKGVFPMFVDVLLAASKVESTVWTLLAATQFHSLHTNKRCTRTHTHTHAHTHIRTYIQSCPGQLYINKSKQNGSLQSEKALTAFSNETSHPNNYNNNYNQCI